MEFASKNVRDAVLKRINERPLAVFDGSNALKIKPAKSKKQMHRNWTVNKARDLVKASSEAQGKTVTEDWQVGGNRGKRQILVDGIVAFEQLPVDPAGIFKGAFSYLKLP